MCSELLIVMLLSYRIWEVGEGMAGRGCANRSRQPARVAWDPPWRSVGACAPLHPRPGREILLSWPAFRSSQGIWTWKLSCRSLYWAVVTTEGSESPAWQTPGFLLSQPSLGWSAMVAPLLNYLWSRVCSGPLRTNGFFVPSHSRGLRQINQSTLSCKQQGWGFQEVPKRPSAPREHMVMGVCGHSYFQELRGALNSCVPTNTQFTVWEAVSPIQPVDILY